MVRKWQVVIKIITLKKELIKILLLFKLKKIYMYDYDIIYCIEFIY